MFGRGTVGAVGVLRGLGACDQRDRIARNALPNAVTSRERGRSSGRRPGTEVRGRARRKLRRHRALKELVAVARRVRLRGEAPDLTHLAGFVETVCGPVQRDEALLLYGLVRVLRPITVVEIGFLEGQSASNFLRALDPDARLYCFDVDPRCARTAEERFGHDPRLVFRLRSQTELTPEDVDGRRAELVFLDASHDLALNQTTFAQLDALMTGDGILAVHDTGAVPRELFPPEHPLLRTRRDWVGDEYEGQPGERAFVNWVCEEYPEWRPVHLHSRQTIRCGITLLQRSRALPRPAAERRSA